MKRSKFIKGSKDMLSRSFNSAKCKTSLKLAASRVKLLRNKKDGQVKQMKRELAQLLESGQVQTARIRVEHVIRDEKMMAAYDLIEIYCELIVARLPIIESQKNCPIDLKEAISSLIFASPRCGDVPELLDARKHFTAKYGKDFVTAAIELRPECGVSRLLVEKLSALAPDGQTKIKILSAIAEEHNVTWDPKSLDEKDMAAANELLKGPSTFEENNKMHARPNQFEVPEPDIQVQPSHSKLHSAPVDFPEQDHRSLERRESFASINSFGNHSTQAELRPPGHRNEKVTYGDGNAFSMGTQTWDMEFKDATSAAQAAAESAERASMAARAAAELSSYGRITTMPSTKSQKSDIRVSADENPWMSSLVKEKTGGESLKSEPFKSEVECTNLSQEKENINYSGEEMIRKQPSLISSHFHHSTSDTEIMYPDSKHENLVHDADEDSFMGIGKGIIHREGSSSHDEAPVLFDESDSDDDDYRFDASRKYDEHVPTLKLSGEGSKLMGNSNMPSEFTIGRYSSPEPSENFAVGEATQLDKSGHVKFDDSDGSGSENGEDTLKSLHSGMKESDHIGSKSCTSSFKERRNSEPERKSRPLFFDDELNSKEAHTKQVAGLDFGSPKNFSFDQFPDEQPSPERSPLGSNDRDSDSSSGTGEGLNFAKLTGGFRHKGNSHHHLLKQSHGASSSKKVIETPSITSQSPTSMAFESAGNTARIKDVGSSRRENSYSASDTDSSEEEELPKRTSHHMQGLPPQSAGKHVKSKPKDGIPSSYFDSDKSDTDEDSQKRFVSQKSNLRNGISRRTKASSSTSEARSRSGDQLESALDVLGRKPTTSNYPYVLGRKPTTSNYPYTQDEPHSLRKNSVQESKTSQEYSFEPLASSRRRNSVQESKTSQEYSFEPPTSSRRRNSVQESKTSQEYTFEPPASSPKKMVASSSIKNPPESASSVDKLSLSKENTANKVSHVHPKLPDYDTIAAKLQSLRMNRG